MTPEELHEWLLETDVSDHDRTWKTSNRTTERGAAYDEGEDDESTIASLDDSWAKSYYGGDDMIEEVPTNMFHHEPLCFEPTQSCPLAPTGTQVQWSTEAPISYPPANDQVSDFERASIDLSSDLRNHMLYDTDTNELSSIEKDFPTNYHAIPEESPPQHDKGRLAHQELVPFLPPLFFPPYCAAQEPKLFPDIPERRIPRRVSLPSDCFTNAMQRSQESQDFINDWDKALGSKRTHNFTMQESNKSRKILIETMGLGGGGIGGRGISENHFICTSPRGGFVESEMGLVSQKMQRRFTRF